MFSRKWRHQPQCNIVGSGLKATQEVGSRKVCKRITESTSKHGVDDARVWLQTPLGTGVLGVLADRVRSQEAKKINRKGVCSRSKPWNDAGLGCIAHSPVLDMPASMGGACIHVTA